MFFYKYIHLPWCKWSTLTKNAGNGEPKSVRECNLAAVCTGSIASICTNIAMSIWLSLYDKEYAGYNNDRSKWSKPNGASHGLHKGKRSGHFCLRLLDHYTDSSFHKIHRKIYNRLALCCDCQRGYDHVRFLIGKLIFLFQISLQRPFIFYPIQIKDTSYTLQFIKKTEQTENKMK